MTNTRTRALTTIDTAELVRNQLGEQLQEHVERMHKREAAARGRLRRAIRFLFATNADRPGGLSPAMQARRYL